MVSLSLRQSLQRTCYLIHRTFTTDAFHPKLTNTNRIFPYFITTSSLTVLFIALLLYLIAQRRLLPSIVIIGAFIFFVLWLTGLVVVSMELWGGVNGSGSVAGNCDALVFNTAPLGVSQATLAWLEQKSICQSWQAVFAFALVGCVFLVWILVIAVQVFYDDDA